MAMADFANTRALGAFVFAAGSWLAYKLWSIARARARTTKLPGPPSKSWLFGVSKEIFDGDSGDLFEGWAQTYGSVYQTPVPFGGRETVLTDPKALAHFFAKTNTYVKGIFFRQLLEAVLGKGLISAEGDDHKRQRKTLNMAFTNTAIRDLVSIFYESGYKAKTAWDTILSSSPNGEAIIDVQRWMNSISLDTIGIAGFGHDFGALHGEHGIVEKGFEEFGSAPPRGLNALLGLLGPVLPVLRVLRKVPTKRTILVRRWSGAMHKIAESLLEKTKKDVEAGMFSSSSRSIMGALIRAESAEKKSSLTEEEVLAQLKTLMFAGYETTSISLTWALIELSLHPEIQERLRKEMTSFENGRDASYDQLMNELPYLDAVLRETLRLHPPVETINRVTVHEDVIPLQTPIVTEKGEVIDHLTVGAGAPLVVPIRAVNRSEALWGSDAKEFKPERWLDNESGLPAKSKEIPGYHHLLTFIDGPKVCLGKLFAVAELKAVLSVLIRNYVFDMRDGPETRVETLVTLLPRPRVVGEEGTAMPLRVRRVEFEH